MQAMSRFANRAQAGTLLAGSLGAYRHAPGAVVVALPRGGVPVGVVVAQALGVPFDFVQVRKLGAPGHEEYAMGTVACNGVCLLRGDVITALGIDQQDVAAEVRREMATLRRREQRYRRACPALALGARVVILVDDGLATGATMRAAVRVVRAQQPARIVAAVPVGAHDACQALRPEVDELVCPLVPASFRAVSCWYDSFEQVADAQVVALLAEARAPPASACHAAATPHGSAR